MRGIDRRGVDSMSARRARRDAGVPWAATTVLVLPAGLLGRGLAWGFAQMFPPVLGPPVWMPYLI